MSDRKELTIVEYFGGDDGHKCGYCKGSKTNLSSGMWAHSLNCLDYQNLIDRGWRRSGQYCYKPDMKQTCCPMYPIRCKATEFQLNRSHKKVIKKMNNFLLKKAEDSIEEIEIESSNAAEERIAVDTGTNQSASRNSKPRENVSSNTGEKSSKSQPKTLEEFLDHQCHTNLLTFKLVKTDSPEFQETVEESHRLYVSYQTKIHQDKADKCTMDQFEGFLVKSPLKKRKSGDSPAMGYGSFHQQYWLENKLIAVGVIDILPHCVSSVYFFYDPDYSHLSLGTYASLREIALVRELAETCPMICWYYLGFYIHSCPKMSYKAQYKPSYLSCPESFTWSPISDCLPKLDQSKYSRLETTGLIQDEGANINLSKVGVLYKGQPLTYGMYRSLNKRSDDEETVKEYAALVGMKSASRMLLYRS